MRRRGSYISRARRDILRDRLDAERQISLSTSSGSNTGELPQFETTNSSVLSELRDILEVLEGGEERGSSDWSSMSEQDLERMLVSLTGSEKKFSTPFEINEDIILEWWWKEQSKLASDHKIGTCKPRHYKKCMAPYEK